MTPSDSLKLLRMAIAARGARSPLDAIPEMALIERDFVPRWEPRCEACHDTGWIYDTDGDINAGHGLGGTEPSKIDCPLCTTTTGD